MNTPSSNTGIRAMTVLLAAAFAAGCSDQGPEDVFLQPLLDARARWDAARPDRYSFELRRTCECTPEMEGPVWVLVEGATAVDWSYGDGSPVAADLQPSFPSVDGLFDIIEDAIRGGAFEVTAQYDVETGVPLQFRIDYEELVFDEEASYRVVTPPRAPDG